jgi:crotonobetainyl-CoA:carnitine CoA-transferase CaiB-like acyl-CoA transferase
MLLGDLGADVIKVERPDIGDESRGWGPPFDERGESAYYLSCNRNKLGVALSLDEPADVLVLRELIRGADVVLDNFKRGTLERRGLSPEDCLEADPRLTWCTLTGFGPDSDRLGYDFVVQAEAGWMSVTGEPGGEPMKTAMAFADVLAGKDATIAILGALAARGLGAKRTPSERRLFISLAHSATAALINVAQNTLVSGKDARRWGNAHANLVPYQLFHASDRGLVIAVGNDMQWQGCCRALGLEELAADARLTRNAGRLAHREELVATIARRMAERPAAEWQARLDAQGVPCGVIRTVREAIGAVSASALTGIGPSIPGSVRRPPPRLNEHGAQVRASGWRAFA